MSFRFTSSIPLWIALLATAIGCGERRDSPVVVDRTPGPSILLVTLDTTRADAIGPEAEGVETPAFNALAERGLRFRQAYTTVPETLPSHTSIMTGLYPAGHGVHQNARYVPDTLELLPEILSSAGYRTAAFISGFPLSRQFGLAAGFSVFDDALGGAERSAKETTDRARGWLKSTGDGPAFLWVHYFDPHHPYEPPAPFDQQYADDPYLGEIAAMDAELGRLVSAFESSVEGPVAIIVAGDHGEGLGEHGEPQHGDLLYQSTMHVPLVIVGPGVAPEVVDAPVSIRRIYHTILDWAGRDPGTGNGEQGTDGVTTEAIPDPRSPVRDLSLIAGGSEIVMGEAMKPYLNYGWQPQTMAVDGDLKVIDDGRIVAFDIAADPAELYDISSEASLSRELRRALREYPIPSIEAASGPAAIDEEDRKQLASLGYIASDTQPVVRVDAPRPTEMTDLFPLLERASRLFEEGDYAAAIPVLRQILARDGENLMAALRLAAAHSANGNHDQAMEAFRRARSIAPESPDVDHYLALHLLRRGDWQQAAPLVERVLEKNPKRLPALAALAEIRERQDRPTEALAILRQIESARPLSADELRSVGRMAMQLGRTDAAISAFEGLRSREPETFGHDLELGVLYLEARRFDEARRALDRVPESHPAYPMALFKRAQVSVLLREPDSAARIERARAHADEVTGPLIERERLFH